MALNTAISQSREYRRQIKKDWFVLEKKKSLGFEKVGYHTCKSIQKSEKKPRIETS